MPLPNSSDKQKLYLIRNENWRSRNLFCLRTKKQKVKAASSSGKLLLEAEKEVNETFNEIHMKFQKHLILYCTNNGFSIVASNIFILFCKNDRKIEKNFPIDTEFEGPKE